MRKLLLTFSLLLLSVSAFAEVAIIIHPSNASSLDKTTIARIYLGKEKSFPAGGKVVPINQKASSAATDYFNTNVVGRSASQLKAYWSKLLFTGKGTPPKEMTNDSEVVKLIASNPNMIGYIDSSAVTPDVKVAATF